MDRITDPDLGPSGVHALPPATMQRLLAAIEVRGLAEYREAILATARPAVRLAREPSDMDAVSRAASRLGGRPDLPPGHPWPKRDGRPLHFLASLRLAEIAPFDVESRLPPTGQLCFWYDAVEQPWGHSPADSSGFAVQHVEDAPLVRTARPDHPADDRFHTRAEFPAARLGFETVPSLVPYNIVGCPDIPRDPRGGYEALVSDFSPAWAPLTPSHTLLGWPRAEQDDVRGTCHRVTGACGAECIDAHPAARAEWRLLLQLDSDDALRWLWGDAGRLFFMIRDADLAAGRFGACWMELQGT